MYTGASWEGPREGQTEPKWNLPPTLPLLGGARGGLSEPRSSLSAARNSIFVAV